MSDSHGTEIVAGGLGGTAESRERLSVPEPRIPIAIRQAELSDLAFIDGLQRKHTKMVGFMPTGQFEGNIKAGRVLIAEEVGSGEAGSSLPTTNCQLPTPIGYCISADRYFKRDDVGIVYQMNVLPGRQRSLVGAMLLKAQFERSAYGCKLYCCWCAQDLAANKFREAMGFVALAFRTGSAAKSRIHIFWQKRIRQGDESTPWWFPSETTGGAVRENRLVLPIPPGTHWSEAKPMVLPGMAVGSDGELSALPLLPAPVPGEKKKRAAKVKKELVVIKPSMIAAGGLRFGAVLPEVIEEKVAVKVKKPKVRNDPKLLAAARELKDRWLEQVNSGMYLPSANGKYQVCREIGEAVAIEAGDLRRMDSEQMRLLPAA